jgi:hypothetical protein
MKYPRTMPDEWYEKFLKITRNTKKEDQKMYIGQVKRLILGDGNKCKVRYGGDVLWIIF